MVWQRTTFARANQVLCSPSLAEAIVAPAPGNPSGTGSFAPWGGLAEASRACCSWSMTSPRTSILVREILSEVAAPDDLKALADKYRTLAALRARRDELEALGRAGFSEGEGERRRKAFRQVARAFPGALRELEVCSAAVLTRKAAAVEAAHAGGPVPVWIEVVLDFHRALREALAVKLWLATRLPRAGRITPELVEAFRIAHPGSTADADMLERHLHPPGGRVLSLAWETVGRRHGLTADQIRSTVFGDVSASPA
jgi:hypothetical protein